MRAPEVVKRRDNSRGRPSAAAADFVPEARWRHSREVLLVCLHPSKGATALQDTSAQTIAMWPMADP